MYRNVKIRGFERTERGGKKWAGSEGRKWEMREERGREGERMRGVNGMLRGDQSLPVLVADFACPLRATPVNLALPLDHWTSSKNRRWKEPSEIGRSNRWVRRPKPASPTTPWGSYVRGDLSIVSSSNLPVEGQIDVTNFSVALFASQITRLSYAETSLFSLGSGRIRCFISPIRSAPRPRFVGGTPPGRVSRSLER